jgi:hypothetical protein
MSGGTGVPPVGLARDVLGRGAPGVSAASVRPCMGVSPACARAGLVPPLSLPVAGGLHPSISAAGPRLSQATHKLAHDVSAKLAFWDM